ncbi:hypothetical protein BDV93DRAFT_548916 [Ceratobasidium sp. AG-I]|nr:hypothetical protein BDV93DRAFT_548916 [Ceratobasidium sp. AG-I]
MDITTSRALAWLISNSEIPATVDLALQAIAGTSYALPDVALHDCGASWSIFQRLLDCFGTLPKWYHITTEDVARLEALGSPRFSLAVVYVQALNTMSLYRENGCTSHPISGDSRRNLDRLLYDLRDVCKSLRAHKSLHISAVGYTGCAIANQYKSSTTFDGRNTVLDISEHILVVLKQQTILPANPCLSVLGLAGILRALDWEGVLTETQASELDPICELLYSSIQDLKPSDQLPLDARNTMSIRRCVTETAFDYHRHLAERGVNIPAIDRLLDQELQCAREPWLISIATSLLEQRTSDRLQHACIHFVARSDPYTAGIGLAALSSAVYAAVQLGIPSNTNQEMYFSSVDLLSLTRHFDYIFSGNEQAARRTITALLLQMLQDNLLGSLLVCMSRASSEGSSKIWRGMKIGYVVEFWGEHIIRLGGTIFHESEDQQIVEQLRNSFTDREEVEFIAEGVHNNVRNLQRLLWHEISKWLRSIDCCR